VDERAKVDLSKGGSYGAEDEGHAAQRWRWTAPRSTTWMLARRTGGSATTAWSGVQLGDLEDLGTLDILAGKLPRVCSRPTEVPVTRSLRAARRGFLGGPDGKAWDREPVVVFPRRAAGGPCPLAIHHPDLLAVSFIAPAGIDAFAMKSPLRTHAW